MGCALSPCQKHSFASAFRDKDCVFHRCIIAAFSHVLSGDEDQKHRFFPLSVLKKHSSFPLPILQRHSFFPSPFLRKHRIIPIAPFEEIQFFSIYRNTGDTAFCGFRSVKKRTFLHSCRFENTGGIQKRQVFQGFSAPMRITGVLILPRVKCVWNRNKKIRKIRKNRWEKVRKSV